MMKKILSIIVASFATMTLAACGNDSHNTDSNQNSVSTSSQTVKSAQRSQRLQGSQTITNNRNQSSTANQTSTQQSKVMSTQQVITQVAQLKHVNLSGGDKIFVTPTSTPNVFKIYIKGANQDPQVDSLIDHYVYNGNTDVISQATER